MELEDQAGVDWLAGLVEASDEAAAAAVVRFVAELQEPCECRLSVLACDAPALGEVVEASVEHVDLPRLVVVALDLGDIVGEVLALALSAPRVSEG